MKKIKIMLMACAICVGINGCKKEGPPGPAGANGVDGNANVVSSTVTVTSWTFVSPSYITDITYPAITSDIINTGAVLVYVSNGAGGYSQLPLTFYTSASYSSTLEVQTSVNLVRIFWTDSDLTTPITPPSMTFKIVVIASSGLIQHPDVDLKNYEEVKKAFNLK